MDRTWKSRMPSVTVPFGVSNGYQNTPKRAMQYKGHVLMRRRRVESSPLCPGVQQVNTFNRMHAGNNKVAPDERSQAPQPSVAAAAADKSFCVRDMDACSSKLQLFESMFGQLVQNMHDEFWIGKKTLMQVDDSNLPVKQ